MNATMRIGAMAMTIHHVAGAVVFAQTLLWAGNARDTSHHGALAPGQDLQLVVESYPAGTAPSARVVYTTDGSTWLSAPMPHEGTTANGANDRWRANLGAFSEGVAIAYAVEVAGDPSIWVKDGEQNFRVAISNAAAGCWIGNLHTWPLDGSIDAVDDLWINIETWPAGVADTVTTGFSTNDGATWTEAPMEQGSPETNNDRWFVNLGRFPEGAEIRLFTAARNHNGETFWDSNLGADYRIRINSPIRDVYTDKGRHAPGSTATVFVDLRHAGGEPLSGVVTVSVNYLARELASFTRTVDLPPDTDQTLAFAWNVPPDDFRGYSVEVELWTDGARRDRRATALDASSDWVYFPRYGFISTFYPGEDAAAQARTLAKYHLNAIQFYDWKWTHDHLVPYAGGVPADLFTQPDGRVQSFRTITAKVAAVQARNMAAMSYSLLYGDSGNDAAPEHLEWAAFKTPFATQPSDIRTHDAGYTIWTMDCSHPDWKAHIIGQFHDAIRQAGFDGVHLDNLGGAWSYRYNSDNGIDERHAFPQFINETRASLLAVDPGIRVAFNDVAENYRAEIAASDADIYYTEVWGRSTYQEIREGILEAKAISGKAVVLAAYINRRPWDEIGDPIALPAPAFVNDASARLMAATVFANGGFRIELGDGGEMLVNEYFPFRTPRMHPGLTRAMRAIYDVAVRYQNLLFFNPEGNVTDGTDTLRIASASHAVDTTARSDTIWTIRKIWPDTIDTISLINLHGVDTTWRDASSTPPVLHDIAVKYHTDKRVRQVLLATPDDGLGLARPLPFTEGQDEHGYFIACTVPELAFWDLLIVDKRTVITLDGASGDWPAMPSIGLHGTAVEAGVWWYRGEADDYRTFGGATSDSDLTEVGITCDDTYVYILARMQDIANPALPALGIAWNGNRLDATPGYPWIGDASTPNASIGLEQLTQHATRQLMVSTPTSGVPEIRLWDGGIWYAPPSADAAVVLNPDDNAIELRINRHDLGLEYPARVAITLATFRSSGQPAGDDATYDSPDANNDAIDVMGGQPGVSENAWARDLHDNRIGHAFDLWFTAPGIAPNPPPPTAGDAAFVIAAPSPSAWPIAFPASRIGYRYTLETRTNLLQGEWEQSLTEWIGTGTDLELNIPLSADSLYLRSSVRLIE